MLECVSPDGRSGFDRGFDVRRGRTGVAGRCKIRALSVSCTARPQPGAEEVGRRAARDLFMHFDKDELGGAVDRDQQVELVLCRPNSAMSIWK